MNNFHIFVLALVFIFVVLTSETPRADYDDRFFIFSSYSTEGEYYTIDLMLKDAFTTPIDTFVPMFDTIIPFVLKHEGKAFVHDSSINEVSRRGITLATYRQYYGKGNYSSIVNLSEVQATAIYKKLFWESNNLDSIVKVGYPKSAAVLMDSEVNLGSHRANKFFQQHVGIPRSDRNGVIDSTTIEFLRNTEINDSVLCTKLIKERRDFYSRLVKKKAVFAKYHRGWNKRLDDMVVFAKEI